jgi:hypothetical protein
MFAQYALHVRLQHAARVERERPDAQREDTQREQRYPVFERVVPKDEGFMRAAQPRGASRGGS